MTHVPFFPHHLPPVEPVPATPWGPTPEWADLPYRAGEIHIGEMKDVTSLVNFDGFEPVRHFHPGTLGFTRIQGD